MVYRVIQWATGRAGEVAVRGVVQRQDMKLVGAWVHSEHKAGRDVGELFGLPALGVRTSNDKEAVLATPADCVCYMAARTWMQNPQATLAELARILRSGKNVVNTTWPALINPAGVSAEVYDILQEACLAGNASFYTAGIDPGHGSIGLALSALTMSRDVRRVHTYEIINYASFNDKMCMPTFGFGQSDVAKCIMLKPGITAAMFASSVRLIAKGLCVALDEIAEAHEVIFADAPFDIAAGHIPAGTISGMRFKIMGLYQGRPLVTIEHVTKLRDQDFPELDFRGDGYRVDVDGEPEIRFDVALSSREGDHTQGAWVATAMAAVNAIPQVCAAPPGVLTYLDLRPHSSTNVVP